MTFSASAPDENQMGRREMASSRPESGPDRLPPDIERVITGVETFVTKIKREVSATIDEAGNMTQEALDGLNKCLSNFRTKADDFFSLYQAESQFLETRSRTAVFDQSQSLEYLDGFFGEASSAKNVRGLTTAVEVVNRLNNLTTDSTVRNYHRESEESPADWNLATLPNGNLVHLEFTYSQQSYPNGKLLEKISLRPVTVRDVNSGVELRPGQAQLELIFDPKEQKMLAVVRDGNGDAAGRLHPEVFLDLVAKLSTLEPATKIAQEINFAEMGRVSLGNQRLETEARKQEFQEAGLNFILDDNRTDPKIRPGWRRYRVQDRNGQTVREFESAVGNDPNVIMENAITDETTKQLITDQEVAPASDAERPSL